MNAESIDPPDPNELILDCYRLADRFKQNPDVFLSMPISAIDDHIHWTIKLTNLQREAQSGGRADDDE